jgi:hypothetical protein
MFAHLNLIPKPLAALAAFAGVVLVGCVDFFTGFDVSLSVFYAMPIILAVWTIGRGYGVFIALIAVGFWFTADRYSGHHFSTPWIMVWNSCVRFCFLMLIVMGSYYARRQLDQTRARAEALEQALPVCHSCKKISDEHGSWVDVETYLAEHLPTRPETKLCPDCAKRLYIDKVSPGSESGRPA